jgi:hypothetical protein
MDRERQTAGPADAAVPPVIVFDLPEQLDCSPTAP